MVPPESIAAGNVPHRDPVNQGFKLALAITVNYPSGNPELMK